MKPSGSNRKLETPKMTAFVASLLSSESKSKLNNTQQLPKTGGSTPSKKEGSPSKHSLKTSVSQNQLTYTLVTPQQQAATTKSFQPVLTKKSTAELGSHSKTPSSSS